jgi:hypothetical protein
MLMSMDSPADTGDKSGHPPQAQAAPEIPEISPVPPEVAPPSTPDQVPPEAPAITPETPSPAPPEAPPRQDPLPTPVPPSATEQMPETKYGTAGAMEKPRD